MIWLIILCFIIFYSYTFDSPVPTPEGYRLVYFGLRDSDSSKYHVEVGTAMLIKIMMVLVLEKGICPGTAIVVDLEGSGWGHLTTLSMTYLRKFMYYIQVCIRKTTKSNHSSYSRSMCDFYRKA